jgi:hypothetical protein
MISVPPGKLNASGQILNLDVSAFPEGVYFVRANRNSDVICKKFSVIKR